MKPYHKEEYKSYKAEFYVFPGLLVAATMSRFPAVKGSLLHGKNRFIWPLFFEVDLPRQTSMDTSKSQKERPVQLISFMRR